ncbi:MAG: helix-turn-helix domain-containing protein [Planctomycetaceae bacterium]
MLASTEPKDLATKTPSKSLRAKVVRAIVDGATYPAVVKRFGVPQTTVWRWVHTDLRNPPVRRQELSAEMQRRIRTEIDASGDSLREIARRNGVHHRTVSKYRDRMTVGGMAPRPHRCSKCGAKIITRKCIRCDL